MNRTNQQLNTTDQQRKGKLTLNRETIQDLCEPRPTNWATNQYSRQVISCTCSTTCVTQ